MNDNNYNLIFGKLNGESAKGYFKKIVWYIVACLGKLLSIIREFSLVPKRDRTRCSEEKKRFLRGPALSCLIRHRISMETYSSSIKVKFGIKVIRLVKIGLIALKLSATGRPSE